MAAKEELLLSLRKTYDTRLFAVEVLSKVFGNLLEVSTSIQRPPEEPNTTESKVIERVGVYAKITLEDEVEVLCYEIELKPHVRIDQSKVAIQHYVRKLLTSGQAALINFISPTYKDMWRFTLVAKDSELVNGSIKEKATHPKRYTFLVESGADKTNRTLVDRLTDLSIESDKNLDTLREAFAVEKMSKAFFDEYKEHYLNFVQYLTGTRMMRIGSKWEPVNAGTPSAFLKSVFNGDEKNARDFCKKLLGRIVFLYFVQKKKWLGASNTDYEDGSQNFIFELFDETGGDERFFPHGLTELFFNALNKERPDDDYTTQTGRKVKIPYLNGGLFTRDEVDELIHKKGDLMTFPSELFSNPDKRDIPVPKGATVEIKESPYRGFLDFLNAFNFTVYEDSQDDHTVAVDPEMLGHIFENLLEDNKDKGAYYTPKEIVSYMCQESLIEYLKTQLPEINENALQKLVREKEVSTISKSHLGEVDNKLREVKVCDPAIGSGAFPMGLLQEIFSIREIVSYEIDLPWDPAKAKEDIIQNSIYGVDIEKGAVDIARLRFWLSLVVDKDKPKALPNLDYKIVVGDSLLSKVELGGKPKVIEIDWSLDTTKDGIFGQELAEKRLKIIQDITDKQESYFHPNVQNKDRLKQEIRDLKIDLLVKQLESMIKTKGIETKPDSKDKNVTKQTERYLETIDWNETIRQLNKLKIKPNEPFNHFDWRLDFPEILNPLFIKDQAGFDIVIGNPPYINLQRIDEGYRRELEKSGFESMAKRGDIYCLFYERSLFLLKDKGILTFVTSNSWLKAKYGEKLRSLFIKQSNPLVLINFEDSKIFDTAIVETNILINRKESYQNKTYALNISKSSKNLDTNSINDLFQDEKIALRNLGEDYWTILDKQSFELKKTIEHATTPIYKLNIEIIRGVITGYNAAFILDEQNATELLKNKKNREIIKPVLRGRDVQKYKFNFSNYYLIISKYQDHDNLIKNYPEVYSHLLKHEKELKARGQVRINQHHWLELDNNPRDSYINLFSQPKLIWGELSDKPKFCFEEDGHFSEATLFVMTGDKLKYLLAILNSKLSEWYFNLISSTSGMGTNRWKKYTIQQLPIKTTSSEIENSIEIVVDYILFLKQKDSEEIDLKLIPSYFEQIVDGIVYELYFPDLLKKYDREVVKHLGDLPELKTTMTDDQKMAVCQEVFKRLDDKEHPVRNNIFYMDSIPEIAIIEGKK